MLSALRVCVLLVGIAVLLASSLRALAQDRMERTPGVPDDSGLDQLLNLAPSSGSGGESALQSWRGFTELLARFYLRDRNGSKNDEQLLFRAEAAFEMRVSESIAAYFRPRVLVDAFDEELRRFEPLEGHVTLTGAGWDLRAGQFVENWGLADTHDPVDILNRRDWAADVLDPERLGELGVRARLRFEGNDVLGEPTIALYALPVFRETLFPPDDQRFGFGTESLPFDEDDGFEPDGDEQAFFAMRLRGTLSSSIAAADAQVVLSAGPERLPVLTVSGGALLPVYYGALSAGGGFRAVFDDVPVLSGLALKAEGVYKAPYEFDDSPIESPDDYVAWVVGVDRAFHNAVLDGDEITLLFEYAAERGASDAATLLRPYQDDLVAALRWRRSGFSRVELELRGVVDLETDELIFEANLDAQLRAIHEDLALSLRAQLFDPPGTGESFFDLFPDNTSIAVGLRWSF